MNDVTDSFIEVDLKEPDDFLKIKETLTRIGIPNIRDHTLTQSCHILQKRGKYFIVHFKELFLLDGLNSSMGEEDYKRRNTIASLLSDWGLLKILNSDIMVEDGFAGLEEVKIISFVDKKNWLLRTKYFLGKYKKS